MPRQHDDEGSRRFRPPKPIQMTNLSDEETDDPHFADRRNFYKVEKWSRDGLRVMMLLYAGNNLDKARRIFERTHKNRPRIPPGAVLAHLGDTMGLACFKPSVPA